MRHLNNYHNYIPPLSKRYTSQINISDLGLTSKEYKNLKAIKIRELINSNVDGVELEIQALLTILNEVGFNSKYIQLLQTNVSNLKKELVKELKRNENI